ncbi:MAG TPA: sigma-70 family RNA polymerase sigma factor [Thermoanaerobaculia bacterium]|nr:sigma-70 family RNA polymerase sigma factor [Thermoanaerobaculia bacterium]
MPSLPSLVDHLFRHEASRLVARLTRAFGAEHLQLAEDVVQEALLTALRSWPYRGVPDDPAAWLWRVARNKALDVLRRDASWRQRAGAVARTLEPPRGGPHSGDVATLLDDELALVFLCCHPALPRDAQVALTLKTAAGFGTSEIARAFLETEPTVAQRLVRAKRKLRDQTEPFEIPAGEELAARLDSVLEVLYLVFNEGYATHRGEEPVRADLCGEALRLVELLTRLTRTAEPRVHALAALFCFQAARLPARAASPGEVLVLDEQDRSLWDRELIRRGLHHFECSARGAELTPYHLQAEIASCHALAESLEETDWARICAAYDVLLGMAPSPVVAVNRAAALVRGQGLEQGLKAMEELRTDPALQGYGPYWTAWGEMLGRAGDPVAAREALSRALVLAEGPPLRRRLEQRLRDLG